MNDSVRILRRLHFLAILCGCALVLQGFVVYQQRALNINVEQLIEAETRLSSITLSESDPADPSRLEQVSVVQLPGEDFGDFVQRARIELQILAESRHQK